MARSRMTAADHVLGLLELLENVLLRIDNKTLLLSQRVNKQFQGTIAGFSGLQGKLFFRKPRAFTGYPLKRRDVLNPLLPWQLSKDERCDWRKYGPGLGYNDADEGYGFMMESEAFHEHSGTTTWFINLKLTTLKRWTGEDSWRRMCIFRDGHVLKHIRILWQSKWLGEKSGPLRLGSVSADVDVDRNPWIDTLGKLVDAAIECGKASSRLSKEELKAIQLLEGGKE